MDQVAHSDRILAIYTVIADTKILEPCFAIIRLEPGSVDAIGTGGDGQRLCLLGAQGDQVNQIFAKPRLTVNSRNEQNDSWKA